NTVVLNVPNGTANGDLLVAQIGAVGGSGTSITAPSGWTIIGSKVDNGTDLTQAIYYRAANNEPASYTWSLGQSKGNYGIMEAWKNPDPTNPINASGSQANASSTSVTAPSITTTQDNCKLLFFGGIRSKSTWTPPTGFTERNHAGGSAATPSAEASDK